jgi:glycine oxidase
MIDLLPMLPILSCTMGTDQLNIAIAGAGVMGLSIVHALREIHEITIYDLKGFPAKNASAMAGGMLAPYAEIDHLPEEFIPAALEGIKFWEALPDCGFMRSGSLIIAHPEDAYILERFAQKLPKQNKANIAALEPGLKKFEHGLFLPGEAHINPALALNALIGPKERMVAQPLYIDRAKDQFDYVIDCRGIEADDKNLRGVKGETVIVRNKEFRLNRPVRLMHPRYPLYIVPRPDNEFMIGATIIESNDETVTLKSAMELLSAAYSLHPSFAEAEIIEIRAGVRPAYADNLPRITIEGNIIHCNGLFRHGYLLAPAIAQCVADHIAGKTNKFSHLFLQCHPEHSEGSPLKRDPSVTSFLQDDDKRKTA